MSSRRRPNGARPAALTVALDPTLITELNHVADTYRVNRSIVTEEALRIGLDRLSQRLWEYRDRDLKPEDLLALLTHGSLVVEAPEGDSVNPLATT